MNAPERTPPALQEVQLSYRYDAGGQAGDALPHPLFALLASLRVHGSIQHAAKALGLSYRHVWGSLKHWEAVLGEPVVTWAQGQPARLTPYAERLHGAEALARARQAPQLEALRAELERAQREARDDRPMPVLGVFGDTAEPALGALRTLAARRLGLHLDLRAAGPEAALRGVLEGQAPLALLAWPADPALARRLAASLKPLLAAARLEGRALLVLGRRELGWMARPGASPPQGAALQAHAGATPKPVPALPGSALDLVAAALRAEGEANDPTGAGAGASLEPAEAEPGALAVAAAIAAGRGDIGLGTAGAAQAHGLDWRAVVDEELLLLVERAALALPAVVQLRGLLASAAWAQALQALPGHRLPEGPAPGDERPATALLPGASPRGRARS